MRNKLQEIPMMMIQRQLIDQNLQTGKKKVNMMMIDIMQQYKKIDKVKIENHV